MNRMLTVAVVLVLAVVLLPPMDEAAASPLYYPPCGAFQSPEEGSFCRPAYYAGLELRISAIVPYAWLRVAPDSTAGVLTTVYPGREASVVVQRTSDYCGEYWWDGYQWWWYVARLDAPHLAGWVEQASLEGPFGPGSTLPPVGLTLGADVGPTQLTGWLPGTLVSPEPGLTFLWLRQGAHSAAPVVASVLPGEWLTIAGEPVFDGVQWWWQVTYEPYFVVPYGTPLATGYVEQALVVQAQRGG